MAHPTCRRRVLAFPWLRHVRVGWDFFLIVPTVRREPASPKLTAKFTTRDRLTGGGAKEGVVVIVAEGLCRPVLRACSVFRGTALLSGLESRRHLLSLSSAHDYAR